MVKFVHPDICGKVWQTKYLQLHESILQGKTPIHAQNYVVSVPVKAGGADILLGMMSLFLYALLTNRAFLHVKLQTEGHHAPVIEHAYQPATFNWESPEISPLLSYCLWPPYDDSMDKRSCDLTPRPFLPHHTHNSTYHSFFMVDSFEQELFWEGDYRHIFGDENSAKNVHLVASNRGNMYMAFFNPHHNRTLIGMGLHKETIFGCLYQYLFRPKSEVCQEEGCRSTFHQLQTIQKQRRLLKKPNRDGYSVWSTMIIAIQVRDLDVTDIDNVWFQCANMLTTEYQTRYHVEKVFYIFINPMRKIQLLAQETYGDRVLFPTGKVVERDTADVLRESEAKDPHSAAKKQAVIDSVRDWEIMAQADVHVVSSRSGFGVVGAMSRVRHPADYRLYNVRDERRDCNIDHPDDLRVYVDQWSGL